MDLCNKINIKGIIILYYIFDIDIFNYIIDRGSLHNIILI